MPAHYTTLQAQLVTDIRSIYGNTFPVLFGRPRREHAGQGAFIQTGIRRSMDPRDGGGPRRVVEEYTFKIRIHLDLPTPYPEYGGEVYAMEQAEYLVDLLAPHSINSMPSPAGKYADIGNPRYVTSVEYVPTADDDEFLAFDLTFQTYCTVNQ